MHRLLSILELLDIIFGFLEPPENAVNALICKGWSDVALDSLWRRVDNILHLFKLLAPLVRKKSELKDIYEFERTPESADWKRFEKYAVRVRILEYKMPKQTMLSVNLFLDVASTRTRLDILPNLHTLRWRESLRHSIIFMHKGVKNFTISLLEEDIPHFRSFFSEAISRMPNIIYLDLYSSLPVRGIEEYLVYFLSHFPQLQNLAFPQYYLTSQLTETLSRLPHLWGIELQRPWDGTGESADVTPFKPNLTEDAFPALSDLSFDATFDDAANFFSLPSPSTNLSELLLISFIMETPASIHKLLTVVSENCQLLRSFYVRSATVPSNLEDENFRITFDTLKPMLKLTNLDELEIYHQYPFSLTQDDVEIIASTWPALEILGLNPEPVHLQKPTLTLDALNPFAQHCPNLKQIGLFIDASVKSDLSPPPAFITFKNLENLWMSSSIIVGAISDVALRLSRIVPPGCKLRWERKSEDPEDPEMAIMRDKWKEIGELLPVLIKARKEERERISNREKVLKDREEIMKGLINQLSSVIDNAAQGVNLDEIRRDLANLTDV